MKCSQLANEEGDVEQLHLCDDCGLPLDNDDEEWCITCAKAAKKARRNNDGENGENDENDDLDN